MRESLSCGSRTCYRAVEVAEIAPPPSNIRCAPVINAPAGLVKKRTVVGKFSTLKLRPKFKVTYPCQLCLLGVPDGLQQVFV